MNSSARSKEVLLESLGHLYTREEFAKLLGVSPWLLLRYHRKGYFRAFISPEKGGRGQRALYTKAQLAEFRRLPRAIEPHELALGGLYTPIEAQNVFGAFDEGKSLRWCVSNIGVLPEAVAALWERYQLLDQGVAISKAIIEEIDKLPHLDGPVPIKTGADLFTVMSLTAAKIDLLEDQANAAKKPPCAGPSCKSTAAYCRECVSSTITEAEQAGYAKGYADAIAAAMKKLGITEEAPETPTGAVRDAEAPVGESVQTKTRKAKKA